MTTVKSSSAARLGPLQAALLAVLAILAFAGNSIIARYALADGSIEPGAFSLIRLAAGALALLPLVPKSPAPWSWRGGVSLWAYVVTFSWAYVSLPAATGALVLFASVQVTILGTGLLRGERMARLGVAGLLLCLVGLAVLLLPEARGGALVPALLMTLSGVAWGAYTMIGRAAGSAGSHTARSFVIGAALALPLLVLDHGWPTMTGILLAVLAGAVTSGLGYVIWNRVSPALGLATLATVQLATPLVAALGGVALLGESLTAAMVGAGALIVVGILLTLRK